MQKFLRFLATVIRGTFYGYAVYCIIAFFHFFGKPLVYMTYSVQIDTETPCKNFFFRSLHKEPTPPP